MRFLLILLVGCAPLWLTPEPRGLAQQLVTEVTLRVECGSEDDFWHESHHGQAVIVDSRHLLTADSLVACVDLPEIWGTRADGRRFKFVVEREDGDLGLARLEVRTAESLGAVAPPTLGRSNSVPRPFRPQDIGAPYYSNDGRLVGIVTGGSAHWTHLAHVTDGWLR